MKYNTVSYWWVLPFPIIINIGIIFITIDLIKTGINIEILVVIIFFIVNNLFAYYGLKYTMSKEPTLELKEDHLKYRGLYKNYIIKYENISKLRKIHEDMISKKDKYITRILLYVDYQKRPIYIMPRIIKGDNAEIVNEIKSRISEQ